MASQVSKESAKNLEGHVYVLTSPACEYIKIGGTDYPPLKRIREINASEPYKGLGPWTLHDFRQVTDWRAVEYSLHYAFRSKLVDSIQGQKELFALSPVEASRALTNINDQQVLRKPKIDRMFQDQDFSDFLIKLFQSTAILHWLNLQGAWVFSLFPSTSGGRYFTLNIGPHEVAFTTTAPKGRKPVHMLHMDRLIHDFPEVMAWINARNGEVVDDNYKSGLYRSTSVFFEGDFSSAQEFLCLHGVRRAILAYWNEALISLSERAALSFFSRHHNWNAVAELKKRIDALGCHPQ
jgi:hypothetical protein